MRAGLLNGEAHSLEELCYPVKADYKGYCTSHKCTVILVPYTTKRGKTGHKSKHVTKRLVSEDRRDVHCPNCGCVIHWKEVKRG